MPQQPAAARGLADRWKALTQARLEYLTNLFESGRWRRFYSEADLLENIREAKPSRRGAGFRPAKPRWTIQVLPYPRSAVPNKIRDVRCPTAGSRLSLRTSVTMLERRPMREAEAPGPATQRAV